MDTYEFDEVKDIIENRRLTTEILNSILESTTRKIDLFDDVESRKILAFLKESNDVPVKVKVYIDDFLKKYKNSLNEEDEKENRCYFRTFDDYYRHRVIFCWKVGKMYE